MWKHCHCKDILYEGKVISPPSIPPRLSHTWSNFNCWSLPNNLSPLKTWSLPTLRLTSAKLSNQAKRKQVAKVSSPNLKEWPPAYLACKPFHFSSSIHTIQWSQFKINYLSPRNFISLKFFKSINYSISWIISRLHTKKLNGRNSSKISQFQSLMVFEDA